MTPEEYAAQQAAISAVTARYVQQFGSMFAKPALAVREWLRLMELLFPQVQQGRFNAASLARRFYDSQRDQQHPGIPRNPRPLESYRFDWFVQNMEPARQRMSQMDAPDDAVAHLAMRAVREVENAGRKQIIHAVENDPEPRIIKGWARVATGRETCAWCLMLISRGPVYLGADTAGLDLSDEKAEDLYEKANGDLAVYYADIEKHVQQWHTGCDCKVVPVFKNENWFGQEAADRALDLWNDATKEAIRLIESGEARSTNRNKEAINALRRRLSRGDISTNEFSALAA
ncbi:capsid maturation protease [Mycobacterium phage MyraDee]|uniref:Capsid maturation protease n=1 Tax=Mycobacterium phage MyraDee TaxID=2024303 RepID=A0A222YXW8_9CAUD|nr:capsid maturation protease [Mycobacterium phage MyraDee]ASR77119.1 capsid maturation protease [Mycobacterium phage MyraDee]